MKKFLLAILVACSLIALASAQENSFTIMQLGKLTASDAIGDSQFGKSMVASGNTLVVNHKYVFVKPSAGWGNSTESATLAPSNGTAEFLAAAVSGNVIAVSASESASNYVGDIYVFVRPAGGWSGTVTETAILSDSSQFCFGSTIGISAGTIVVGMGNINGSSVGNCAFVMPKGGWRNATHADATLTVPYTGGYFTASTAITGDTIVTGIPGNFDDEGTVYVFTKPASGWSGNLNPTATLVASDAQFNGQLGLAVSISGSTIATTAVNALGGASKVYIFTKPAGGWVDEFETAQLHPPKGSLGFASSVAIAGNSVLVGAASTTVNFNQLQGAAYLFVKPQSGWKTTAIANTELFSSDGVAGDAFGSSVAIGGGDYFAGAPFAAVNGNLLEGAAYVLGK
jgi:hypothetical protein